MRTASVLVLDGNPLKWNEGMYDPEAEEMKMAMERVVGVVISQIESLK